MEQRQQRIAARDFVKYWQAADGYEMGETVQFWTDLCQNVFGVPNTTRNLDFERKVQGKRIDMFYEDRGILVEQKSRGVNLDALEQRGKKWVTPFQQALEYTERLPLSIRPRWIIACNFDEFRIYDQEHPDEEYVSVMLTELESVLPVFSFFVDDSSSRIVREQKLSIEAGRIVGRLYELFSSQYRNIDTDEVEQRSLNILITRLVFLLYAEDAGLLQEHQAFCNYLKRYDASQCRNALIELFRVLATPDDERDLYLDEVLAAFPYVNGGLFSDGNIIIPQFNEEIRINLLLEASIKFDWSDISPTIFGAVFESTLNPETRRKGGMHYTSVENIHKVIDPLFLDDLREELEKIEGIKVEKQRKTELRAFQYKLSQIKCLDPAAGSCNFLTETYLSLRKLELRVLEDIMGNQSSLLENPIMVNIKQFYGIEINDFAVAVGKTALWIAEQQMLERTQELLPFQTFNFFPLSNNVNIVCGNALRMDWNEVLPAEDASYCYGNPPFKGYSNLSKEQEEDRVLIFGKIKIVDYVSCWYWKASEYMRDTTIRTAFVSTNSICQGQQVEPVWKPLFEDGIHIDFAYKSFIWDSDAVNKAHVHVVIVGFSRSHNISKILYSEKCIKNLDNINGYLASAPDVFISKRIRSLCCAPAMVRGCQPTDAGNLLLNEDEKNTLISLCPNIVKWIRPFSMGSEFIKGINRYCLWLENISPSELESMPDVKKRVEAVRVMRLASVKKATRKKANTPWLFDEIKNIGNIYIGIPKVSSERRKFIPMGFVKNSMIPGDKLYFINTESLYHFGILLSTFHNAWMRMVCGRLKSDYSYSNTIVYNNFIWPGVASETISIPVEDCVSLSVRQQIESCAQSVLDARDAYQGKSLADLYDPDKMPADLNAAHKKLDAVVEAAYGVDFNGDEEKIVAHLFKLYAELTK